MKEKVVLAYSGGLDTTAIIPWLKEQFDYAYDTFFKICGDEKINKNLVPRRIYGKIDMITLQYYY